MAASRVRKVAAAFVVLGLLGIVWVLLVGGPLLIAIGIAVEVVVAIAAYCLVDAEGR